MNVRSTVLVLLMVPLLHDAADAQGLDPGARDVLARMPDLAEFPNLGVLYCGNVMPEPDSIYRALPSLESDGAGNMIRGLGPITAPEVLQARVSDLLNYTVCLERIAAYAYELVIEEWAQQDCVGQPMTCIAARRRALSDSLATEARTP